MDRRERFNAAYQHLCGKGVIRRQKDLAAALHTTESNVSKILKGDERALTDNVCTRMVAAFPEFSLEWLMDGKGTMLIDDYKPKEPGVRTYGVDDLLAVKDEVIEQLKARLEEVTTSKDEIIRLLKEQNELLKRDEISLSTGQWAAEERSRD